MKKYEINLFQKKSIFVSANNKRDARKKARERMGKGIQFFLIEDVTEYD